MSPWVRVSVRALESNRNLEKERQRAILAFERYDIDQNGVVDAGELKSMAAALGAPFESDEAIVKAMNEIDKNGDHVIDLDEWTHWWMHTRQYERRDPETLVAVDSDEPSSVSPLADIFTRLRLPIAKSKPSAAKKTDATALLRAAATAVFDMHDPSHRRVIPWPTARTALLAYLSKSKSKSDTQTPPTASTAEKYLRMTSGRVGSAAALIRRAEFGSVALSVAEVTETPFAEALQGWQSVLAEGPKEEEALESKKSKKHKKKKGEKK